MAKIWNATSISNAAVVPSASNLWNSVVFVDHVFPDGKVHKYLGITKTELGPNVVYLLCPSSSSSSQSLITILIRGAESIDATLTNPVRAVYHPTMKNEPTELTDAILEELGFRGPVAAPAPAPAAEETKEAPVAEETKQEQEEQKEESDPTHVVFGNIVGEVKHVFDDVYAFTVSYKFPCKGQSWDRCEWLNVFGRWVPKCDRDQQTIFGVHIDPITAIRSARVLISGKNDRATHDVAQREIRVGNYVMKLSTKGVPEAPASNTEDRTGQLRVDKVTFDEAANEIVLQYVEEGGTSYKKREMYGRIDKTRGSGQTSPLPAWLLEDLYRGLMAPTSPLRVANFGQDGKYTTFTRAAIGVTLYMDKEKFESER